MNAREGYGPFNYAVWAGAGPQPPQPQPQPQPQPPDAQLANGRGQYGQPRDYATRARSPWTEAQRQAFQRSLAVSTIGSVAGAVLWKSHRIWGFILGGMAAGAVGNLVFSPPTTFDGFR